MFVERALFAYWGVTIQGTFLTNKQSSEFSEQVEVTTVGALVLKLPALPAKTSVTIIIYGNLVAPEVHVSAPQGVRHRVDFMVLSRRRWFTGLSRPWELPGD